MSVMPLVLVLALSVLGQAFLAGAAAAIDPAYWTLHKSWIAVFQWLSVLLAVAAWAGKQDALTRWLSTAPIVLIRLQYSFIHLAIGYGASGFAGLHAVAGFLLFGHSCCLPHAELGQREHSSSTAPTLI